VISFPFHADERLSDGNIPWPADAESIVDPQLPAAGQWERFVILYDALATEVAGAAEDFPVVVTGDCMAAAGTLTGLQRAGLDPGVVWFDAHGDVHALDSSTSGYLGGLSLRLLAGGNAERLAEPLGMRPVPEDRCVLVDARDLDPAEREYLAASRIGRRSVAEIQAADLPDGVVLLHVDLDVIDASEVPGLRFPVGNGPTAEAVIKALARLLASGRVAALEITCPWFDPDGPADTAARTALLGRVVDLTR
jgi:arginase